MFGQHKTAHTGDCQSSWNLTHHSCQSSWSAVWPETLHPQGVRRPKGREPKATELTMRSSMPPKNMWNWTACPTPPPGLGLGMNNPGHDKETQPVCPPYLEQVSSAFDAPSHKQQALAIESLSILNGACCFHQEVDACT